MNARLLLPIAQRQAHFASLAGFAEPLLFLVGIHNQGRHGLRQSRVLVNRHEGHVRGGGVLLLAGKHVF